MGLVSLVKHTVDVWCEIQICSYMCVYHISVICIKTYIQCILIYLKTICIQISNEPEHWYSLIWLAIKMSSTPNYFLMWYVKRGEYQFWNFSPILLIVSTCTIDLFILSPLYLYCKGCKMTLKRKERRNVFLVNILKDISLMFSSDTHWAFDWFLFSSGCSIFKEHTSYLY